MSFLPLELRDFGSFMKGTAKEYNLEMENTVDERYHLEKATEAACLYLKKAKEENGELDIGCCFL